MFLAYIKWNLDPEIFSLGPLSIRWYGLLFALGFVVGYIIFQQFFRKEGIKEELLDKLTIYVALGTIIGARLGHVIFYDPRYYLENPVKIIKTWEGGLASHGGVIGILIAIWFFSRNTRISYLWVMDRIVIMGALAGFFIRMGNLMNSEIYGVQTDLPWGFIFLRKNEIVPKHPTQIYEALAYLLIFGILYLLNRGYYEKLKRGFSFGLFFILLFTTRFFIEFIKEDQSDFEAGMALNMGQILSLPFILAGIAIVIWSLKQDKLSRAYHQEDEVDGKKIPSRQK